MSIDMDFKVTRQDPTKHHIISTWTTRVVFISGSFAEIQPDRDNNTRNSYNELIIGLNIRSHFPCSMTKSTAEHFQHIYIYIHIYIYRNINVYIVYTLYILDMPQTRKPNDHQELWPHLSVSESCFKHCVLVLSGSVAPALTTKVIACNSAMKKILHKD